MTKFDTPLTEAKEDYPASLEHRNEEGHGQDRDLFGYSITTRVTNITIFSTHLFRILLHLGDRGSQDDRMQGLVGVPESI